jgi:hypothetical protein
MTTPETSLDEVIKETKEVLQPLFKKPKLTSKLLSKPPFRFIHDIVTATLETTGFPREYFASDKMDSTTYKDSKSAKISFLDKLIKIVSVGSGESLEANSSKIVAGLEPLDTNKLLVALGRLATNDEIDRKQLVRKCLKKDSIGSRQEQKRAKVSRKVVVSVEEEVAAVENMEVNVVGSTTNSNTEATSTTRAIPLTLVDQVKTCNTDINQTRKMISSIISKPKCTEKLLNKPPFRFLHDVIMALGKATGFDLSQIFRLCSLSYIHSNSPYFDRLLTVEISQYYLL